MIIHDCDHVQSFVPNCGATQRNLINLNQNKWLIEYWLCVVVSYEFTIAQPGGQIVTKLTLARLPTHNCNNICILILCTQPLPRCPILTTLFSSPYSMCDMTSIICRRTKLIGNWRVSPTSFCRGPPYCLFSQTLLPPHFLQRSLSERTWSPFRNT